MARNKLTHFVIDTNLWISFLISNRQSKLDSILLSSRFRLLFSTELLEEINNTINKPKLRKYFGAHALEEMLIHFEPYIDLIEVKSKAKACRDPKDNFLLALSKDGKADYLLTGDQDLLELKQYGKTKILTISRFIEEAKELL